MSRYRYDIDGIVQVHSSVRLPELKFFSTKEDRRPDLVVRMGTVGAKPRLNTTIKNGGMTLRYEEHLGWFSANFKVHMGDPVEVTVNPILALSPHVVYTNIIEVLLRFLMVKHGRMLLHSACINLRGRGILLSAETDTGKTSTVLRLLRDEEGWFFSDDMTIMDADGLASRYPKPMTISAHTLKALDLNRLNARQRAALMVQSRVHSREGRTFAKRLAELNLPIMTINSVMQTAVPPPKYMVDTLVDCEIGERTAVDALYFIERGTPTAQRRLNLAEVVERLQLNTEDAYGFPPYSQLAPHLVIGGHSLVDMLESERRILESAMKGVHATLIRVNDFGWSKIILDDLSSSATELVGRPSLSRQLADEKELAAAAAAS